MVRRLHRTLGMKKLVTCPETAHLEQIDFDLHPLGVLIHECSRFSPSCDVRCSRTCAARMDQRARLSSRPPLLAVAHDDSDPPTSITFG
jgi:hypothetical protein